MAYFNWRGAIGFALSVFIAGLLLAAAHSLGLSLSTVQELAYGAILAVFFSAIYGLTVDRCDLPGLWPSYRANMVQSYYPAAGQRLPRDFEWVAERRLAVFVWPLALGPAFLTLVAGLFWGIDAVTGTKLASAGEYAVFFFACLLSAVVAWLYARATHGQRLIVGATKLARAEADALSEEQGTSQQAQVARIIRGDSTAETPSRSVGFVLLAIGLAGITVSGALTPKSETHLLIVLACPMLTLLGAGSVFDPRIVWSLRAEGRIYPASVRAIGAVLAVLGIAIGASWALSL